ncbi:MAG: molybdenum cofactor guanylyltransferase [Flavobacteriaceae bacterium]
MNKSIPHTTGYILAGGKSSRMGEDKGLKLFNGKALVQTVIDQMQLAVDKVVLVSNNSDYKQFGLEVIEDVVKNIGPAGGIYTALQHSVTDKNFIVSCDMPHISFQAIQFMLENCNADAICIPLYRNSLEPLFGVYPKGCLTSWKTSIEKGIYKLTDLAENHKLEKVVVDHNPLFSEKLFQNLNTPDEFKNALKNV